MPNALEMIREDHHKVQQLFQEFETIEDRSAKKRIVENAIQELKTHAALEEELFYPAARKQLDEEDTIDEALEEHHVVKLLIAELEDMRPGDKRYDAKFTVLAESVKHHIEEEESELLPEIEPSLDAESLGEKMQQRKQELLRRASNGAPRRRARGRSQGSRRGAAARSRGRKKSNKRPRQAR
ncbi:MAG: hemerythrin domain-containing protein [Candidatus Binatia bacterium]